MSAALQSHRPEEPLSLTARGVSETFSEADAIKVPSCRPTPLIGSWADESFPLNSRQASEIVFEAQRQRSSIVFEDDDGNELTYNVEDEEGSVDDLHTAEVNSELNENVSVAYNHQSSSDNIGADSAPNTPTHVARCYAFDPYNVTEPYNVLYCCYCDECNAMVQSRNAVKTNASLTASTASYVAEDQQQYYQEAPVVSNAPPKALGASPLSPLRHAVPSSHARHEYEAQQDEWDAPRSVISASSSGAPTRFATHLTHQPVFQPKNQFEPSPRRMPAAPRIEEVQQPPAVPTTITTFMPPPPPPRIFTLVLEEEGSPNPSGIFYHLLMRWYNRVVQSQEYFVSADDLCPPPNKELYSFDQWADNVSGWWYTHFEHMQKKASRFPAARGRAMN